MQHDNRKQGDHPQIVDPIKSLWFGCRIRYCGFQGLKFFLKIGIMSIKNNIVQKLPTPATAQPFAPPPKRGSKSYQTKNPAADAATGS